MSHFKRIYRRVTTTERIVVPPQELAVGPIHGETFRVEVFVKEGSEEKLVYEREHTGTVEVEELADGNIRLCGTKGADGDGVER